MRFPRFSLLAALCLATAPLAAQQLVCSPAAPGGRGCELFHYHVLMYRPDNKQRVEIFATPQFATQAACERAREAKLAANTKVVEFFRGIKQQQYEPDRFGPCHCDMTGEKGSAHSLTDAMRATQLRNAEEIRLRVRERLLDVNLLTDHEVVRALDVDAPVTPLLGTPKLVPLPQAAPVAVVTAADDLRPTRTIDTSKPTVTALDMPLVDILAEPAPAPPPAPAAADAEETTAAPIETAPAPTAAAITPAPIQEPPISETVVDVPAPVVAQPPQAVVEEHGSNGATEEEIQSAEEIAERFIEYEMQRVQNVLKAATNITDSNVSTRIFQACMQRIHLLSNLRVLIEGAGTRSPLAAAARAAESEEQRLALIAKLFGDEITEHWAPKDAVDAIFDVEESVANAPERVLRDTSGAFTTAQKKRALYLVLAQTEPTEDQRLWLSTVVERFLR